MSGGRNSKRLQSTKSFSKCVRLWKWRCLQMDSGVFYAMPNQDIEKEKPEGRELVDFSAEIKELKEDVRELLNLVQTLASFVEFPVSGSEEEKDAIEFENRLAAMVEKHARGPHLTKRTDGIEGQILL